MTEEDEEFNRIEREASMRQAAVRATVTKKEWVGLTDKEEVELWESTDSDWELMKRTEKLLKEKNT